VRVCLVSAENEQTAAWQLFAINLDRGLREEECNCVRGVKAITEIGDVINPNGAFRIGPNALRCAPPTINVGSKLRPRKTKRAAPARRINKKQANYFL
jgi:hypothetical protein